MTSIGPTTSAITRIANLPATDANDSLRSLSAGSTRSREELHEAFTNFVGQTFYGQMIKAMRSTVGKPAYFHGGQGEEIFRGQLDQVIAEQLTDATAAQFADPMFEQQFPGASVAQSEASAQPGLNLLSQLSRR